MYLTTMQFDFTLPLVLLAQGEALGGVLLATPISSTSLAMFMGFKKAFRYAILVKTLGVNKLKKYFEKVHLWTSGLKFAQEPLQKWLQTYLE